MQMGGQGFALAFYSTGRVSFIYFFASFLSFFFVGFLSKLIEERHLCFDLGDKKFLLFYLFKNLFEDTLGPSGGRVGGGIIKWNQQSVVNIQNNDSSKLYDTGFV